MDIAEITKTTDDVVELFQVVMKLYAEYFETIEICIKNTPETETETLQFLRESLSEAQSSLEHDLGIFHDAIDQDKEGVNKMKDSLQIESIYNRLNIK